jgi:hypothetical protein
LMKGFRGCGGTQKKPQISSPRCAPVEKHFHERSAELQTLGYPGFPVENCCFGQIHVVLFKENHISGAGESCEVGNPGTLGMTKERATAPWKAIAGPR